MTSSYRWVLSYDRKTGERVHFTTCPKNKAMFYEELYKMDGYEVRVLTDEEIDGLIASEGQDALSSLA